MLNSYNLLIGYLEADVCVLFFFRVLLKFKIQSTLIISTSIISNNRLSRSENLVLF